MILIYPIQSYAQNCIYCKTTICHCNEEGSGIDTDNDYESNNLDIPEDIEDSLDGEVAAIANLYPELIDYFEWYLSIAPGAAQYLYNITTENEDVAYLLNLLVKNYQWNDVSNVILLYLIFFRSGENPNFH